MQWLGASLGSAGTHNSPLPSRSSQARKDISLVPAAQGFTPHKHSHTNGPLLGTRLVMCRCLGPLVCVHVLMDIHLPLLTLMCLGSCSPLPGMLFSPCPGPTLTRVAQTLPSPQSTHLPPGDGALPAEPPVLSRPPQVRSTFRLVLSRSIPVPLTCIGPHLTVFVPRTQPRSGVGSVA